MRTFQTPLFIQLTKLFVRIRTTIVCVALCSLFLFVTGCDLPKETQMDLKSEYQAVFLINGQTFIGKLNGAGTDYPMLTDVFYIQSVVNQETKAVSNILVKRGKEWHGPEFMYINAKNILLIEPVAPNSQVAMLIKEAKAQTK